MKARFLPKIPDIDIESEAVQTWNIENYRSLSKKERGPNFDCGGHPWYVHECLSPWAVLNIWYQHVLTGFQENLAFSVRQ